ncbi:MAG: hypothetical protein JSW56_03400 [Deltaproteobacteria bacterium]|nr:MAG: hypothetical protein JSW56_03400 [Deltaproteobacteria bacterium]
MLNTEERRLVYEHAYLPEHLPDYVEAISGAEVHLQADDYLCFSRGSHLIFIGYPLKDETSDIERAYQVACERFRPSTLAIIAPKIWLPPQKYEAQPEDSYYRLDLPLVSIDAEVAYMVRRAGRELRVEVGVFGKEHNRLVKGFISGRELGQEQKKIYREIPSYLKRSKTAHLLEARKGDRLVAFNIVDMGSAHYAFFLFNVRSMKSHVPGASDLLFHEMVRLAEREGKEALNLGLGINPGVRRFKEKWGGKPFLTHASALVTRKPLEMGRLADKL